MKMLTLLCGFSLLVTYGARAQSDTARWTIGETQVKAGTMRLGLDRLNAGLAANNRPTFSNIVPVLGIATHARRGRLLGGASIDGSLSHRTSDAEWTTKLYVGTATLDVGYVVLEGCRLMISGIASLGVQSTSLHFERRGDFTYGDGLEDPARGVDLMSRGGLAQLGVNAEWRLELPRIGSFALGSQAGVTRPLGAGITFAGENRVRQTPEQNGGTYLRVAFSKPLADGRRALDAVGAAALAMLFR